MMKYCHLTSHAFRENADLSSVSGLPHPGTPSSRDRMAASWVMQTLGFQPGFDTARMYLGKPPEIDMSSVFAVTTLELG
jgi:hypothetical protein